MCQLTFLHGQTPIVKGILGNITLMNSAGNTDGHGLYFPPPIKKYYKTKVSGGDKVFQTNYWDRVESCIGDLEEIALLSHVRSASLNHKIINAENAHPHQVGSIILMHNGTLEPDDINLEIEDRIDSYWYTARLAEIVGRKHLKPQHISEAMEDFRGKFAFLIADTKQPDIIYVVKGKSASLGYANYIDDEGKNICFAINTMRKSLEMITLPMFFRAITSKGLYLAEKPVELEDESIYVYDIPKGALILTEQKVEERATVHRSPAVNNRSAYGSMGYREDGGYTSYQSASSEGRLVYELSMAATDMELSFSELNHMFLLLHGCSILYASGEEIKSMASFLEKLRKTWETNANKKKGKLWMEARQEFNDKYPSFPTIHLYQFDPKLRFPWFLNSVKGLKNVRSRVKARSNNGA